MPLSIEQSQKILDLRVRMAANAQAGKAEHDGITPEEYREVLDMIRSNRANAVAAGVAKATSAPRGRKKKMEEGSVAPGVNPLDDPKFARFKKFNLD
jgi:hypothetical protein